MKNKRNELCGLGKEKWNELRHRARKTESNNSIEQDCIGYFEKEHCCYCKYKLLREFSGDCSNRNYEYLADHFIW